MKRTMLLAAVVVFGGILVSEPGAKEEKKAEAKAVSAQEFATKASAAGLAEVNLSSLAKDRASRAEVKHFAQHMIDDHTKANMELLQLVNAKKLRAAERMDDEHQKMHERLSGLKGEEFDRQYMTVMLKDHEEAVALFGAAAKGLDDKDLQAWAAKTLPTLRGHLDMARKAAGQGGRDTKEKDATKDKDR